MAPDLLNEIEVLNNIGVDGLAELKTHFDPYEFVKVNPEP